MHRAAALLLLGAAGAAAADVPPGGYDVVGDGIPLPLTTTPGDAARGRAIVAGRQTGLCLLCHAAPIPEERLQGNIGTDLAGAGARWTVAQLRLRVADARRLNPATTMPATYRTDGLQQVGSAWQGRPLLSAQQVEDVVAYLGTLR
jgi:sulfur-oxidizing protein SoxX